MSHHGIDPNDAFPFDEAGADKKAKAMRELLQQNIGPTNRFPEGHLNKSDEGEISFAVGNEMGKVIINFGSPVAWMGMNANQAEELARLLLAHAERSRLIGSDRTSSKMEVETK